MGNQGHSSDDARLINEHIAAGTIGEVREVHVWTNRPLTHWPQGIPRPEKVATETLPWNMSGVMQRLANAMAGDYPAPSQLRWDLFLGPSPQIPYHPVYHPFNWRGWVDWGCGAIGDMGAHLIDHPFWALESGLPHQHRNGLDALQQGNVSDGDDDVLRVPGARRTCRRCG